MASRTQGFFDVIHACRAFKTGNALAPKKLMRGGMPAVHGVVERNHGWISKAAARQANTAEAAATPPLNSRAKFSVMRL
jgi:hypothetical protein